MFTSLFSLTISPYTPQGVYCVIYPQLRGNIVEFDFSIPLLRMIKWTIKVDLGNCLATLVWQMWPGWADAGQTIVISLSLAGPGLMGYWTEMATMAVTCHGHKGHKGTGMIHNRAQSCLCQLGYWTLSTASLSHLYSAVQCSAVQCSVVQCSAVQCSAVKQSRVQCSVVQCSTVMCSVMVFRKGCGKLEQPVRPCSGLQWNALYSSTVLYSFQCRQKSGQSVEQTILSTANAIVGRCGGRGAAA